MKEHSRLDIGTIIFIIIESILYVSFMCCDLFFHAELVSSCFKYASIVICLAMTVYLIIRDGFSIDRMFLVFALGFTVLADIFLLFTNKYVWGVLAFLVVQTIYLLRCVYLKEPIERMKERVTKRTHKNTIFVFLNRLVIRLIFGLVVVSVLIIANIAVDWVLVITAIYMVSFVGNIIFIVKLSLERYRFLKPMHIFLFLIGMCLFFLCDIQVGLNNVASYISLSSDTKMVLYQIVGVGMWGCYLPGQMLIVLSGAECLESE